MDCKADFALAHCALYRLTALHLFRSSYLNRKGSFYVYAFYGKSAHLGGGGRCDGRALRVSRRLGSREDSEAGGQGRALACAYHEDWGATGVGEAVLR